MCMKPYRAPEQGLEKQLSLSHIPSSWHLGPCRSHPLCPAPKPTISGLVSHKGTEQESGPQAEGLLALITAEYRHLQLTVGGRAQKHTVAPSFLSSMRYGRKAPSKGMRRLFCGIGGPSSQAGLGSDQFSVFVPHCPSFSILPTSLCRNSHVHSHNTSPSILLNIY